MPKPVLADTTMCGDWPDENCGRCGTKGAQVIHWGSLAALKEDNKTRTATLFCRRCWHEKAEKYRETES